MEMYIFVLLLLLCFSHLLKQLVQAEESERVVTEEEMEAAALTWTNKLHDCPLPQDRQHPMWVAHCMKRFIKIDESHVRIAPDEILMNSIQSVDLWLSESCEMDI